jgi:hypothetical protein
MGAVDFDTARRVGLARRVYSDSMTVNIPLLLLALLLLWVPRQWLRLGQVLFKRRSRSDSKKTIVEPRNTSEPGDPRVSFRAEFGKFRNYVDLLRGVAGAICVVGGLNVDSSLLLAERAPSSQVKGLIAVKGLILLIGLVVQTIRYERKRLTFYPPIFYLAGLSVALCEPAGAGFAFAAIWAINPMFSSAQGFLTLYAVLMVAFGQYFSGVGNKSSIFAGVLCFLPALLSLLADRPLVILARKATRRAEDAAT